MDDYSSFDGVALAELVRTKEVTPLELVDSAIARIEALNPKINAVVHRMYDRARTQAKLPLSDARFHGVPVHAERPSFLVRGRADDERQQAVRGMGRTT